MSKTRQSRFLAAICASLVLAFSATGLTAQDLFVESISIENGAVDVPEITDIAVTFNIPIVPNLFPGGLDGLLGGLPIDIGLTDPECPLPPAGIFVTPGGCPESVELSGDSRTVTLHNVQLEPDTAHTLFVIYARAQNGALLTVPAVRRFSTGSSLPQGGIAGAVSATGVSPTGSIVLAIEGPIDFASEDLAVEPFIGFADENGDYSLDFLPDGTYFIVALQLDLNDIEGALENLQVGTVDGDGNNVADPVTISGENVVSGADVMLSDAGATASELNGPVLDIVHTQEPDATLGIAVGGGVDLSGEALTWAYVYASITNGTIWAAATLGPFAFPPQQVDLGEDGALFAGILGATPVPADFGDSDTAVINFLSVGGADFLTAYQFAIGVAVVMNAELYAFLELLLEGGLDGVVAPMRKLFGRFEQLPDFGRFVSKRTGEVWIVGFIAPIGPALHLAAMDDSGNPLLVIGSAAARANESSAAAVASAWAGDAVLVTVSTNVTPIDQYGASIAWGFNYYSAAKDSVLSVAVSGGDLGGVLSTVVLTKEEVPSTSALPAGWIDSPQAVNAGRSRGDAFIATHPDAIAAAVLSRGLQAGNPNLAIWRLGFTGTAAGGDTEFLNVDIDAESGVYVAVEDDRTLPTAFELGQNYPNPFNPSTIIPYRVAERGHVTLEVFDMLGRRVATLVDGIVSPGSYEATWNVSATGDASAPSGVYVYRLKTEGSVFARTMMMVK